MMMTTMTSINILTHPISYDIIMQKNTHEPFKSTMHLYSYFIQDDVDSFGVENIEESEDDDDDDEDEPTAITLTATLNPLPALKYAELILLYPSNTVIRSPHRREETSPTDHSLVQRRLSCREASVALP